MSQETMQWLNNMTLIGFTEKRGQAWHYRSEDQGAESNHYPGAIPIADVKRRLFSWLALEAPVQIIRPDGKVVTCEDRKAILHGDTFDVLGIFKDGYTIHQYDEWLLANIANILDDDLAIGSAGLLRKGGQAFVTVETPDNIITPDGVEFRPNILAATSLDGSLSTTYKPVATVIVCDNTLAAGLGEKGGQYKVKHSRYSYLKIADARDAMGIIHATQGDFEREVAALCDWTVTDAQWERLLDECLPTEGKKQTGVTIATKKRELLGTIYNTHTAVKPWKGSAFGVLQAWNTHQHHYMNVKKGVSRAQRNMEKIVNGDFFSQDTKVLTALVKVTGKSPALVGA